MVSSITAITAAAIAPSHPPGSTSPERYFCAYRIGLDGASCLLRVLCKGLSFDCLLAVLVIVLAYPALELFILLEQELECLADDVGSVCVDELGVLVEFMPDLFLQADLKVCSLRLL